MQILTAYTDAPAEISYFLSRILWPRCSGTVSWTPYTLGAPRVDIDGTLKHMPIIAFCTGAEGR